MSPFVIVIFGATGDLAQHKLIPSLYSLFTSGQIGKKFYIVGFARRSFTDGEYREMLKQEIPVDEKVWEEFSKNIYYQQGLFDEKQGYEALIEKLNGFDSEIGACITRVFYLATPSNNYEMILENLHKTKLSEGCGPAFASAIAEAMADKKATAGKQGLDLSKWTRVAIEKPFGKDLETARFLDKKLSEVFEEKQIYRVDHYLAKETVQNMIAFRFANSIFEPVWNKEHIDHVQITFAEKKMVGKRGKFFDGVGMLRDVAQNHLLQLLAAVAMEQPMSFTKESVRDARANAVKAIRCPELSEIATSVVRGQYEGYRQEKDVSPNSQTDTFVAMKLFVDTPRFEGVPFYLRAGKGLAKDLVEIKVVFKQTCHLLFKEYGCPEVGNVLTIRIQPNEGIAIRVIAKDPSFAKGSGEAKQKLALSTVDMKFSYAEEFGQKGMEAYDRLLLDILMGDQMLFNRSDELESSWQFISGILAGWSSEKPGAGLHPAKQNTSIPSYEKGTWGPKEADDLIAKDGRKWLG